METATPRHRQEIPAHALKDMQRMFRNCNDAYLEAFTELKNTLIEEEMYMMLKQLHEMEQLYGIDIPYMHS